MENLDWSRGVLAVLHGWGEVALSPDAGEGLCDDCRKDEENGLRQATTVERANYGTLALCLPHLRSRLRVRTTLEAKP